MPPASVTSNRAPHRPSPLDLMRRSTTPAATVAALTLPRLRMSAQERFSQLLTAERAFLASAATQNCARFASGQTIVSQPDELPSPFDVQTFYGWRPNRTGAAVGCGALHTWWEQPITVGDLVYPTAEHLIMATKAQLIGDLATLDAILAAASASVAHSLGTRSHGAQDGRWLDAEYQVLVAVNVIKFSQHAELGRFLRDTAPKLIVYATPQDKVWGAGLAARNKEILWPAKWKGTNLLGLALWETRQRLDSEEATDNA